MSGLTDAERDALHAPHAVPINPAWWSGCPICHEYLAAVEAIVTRVVNEALTEAADEIEAQDPAGIETYPARPIAQWLRQRALRARAT